jgi:transposase
MPFLRAEKKASGTYLRILESYRNEAGQSTHRILYSLGKVEDYTPEQLRSIGIKLFELGGGEVKALLHGELEEMGRYNYGYQQIYGKALQHYGLHDVFRRIEKKSKLQFSLYDSVFLMLLERLQEPCSKHNSFLNQHEYLQLPAVALHHLYRALDKLAANNLLIQQQIFTTGRDLFNQRLDVVFYDVTTFYFESEVEKEGELRQMGFGKDGKIGNTQILFCMMIDRDKNPIGYRIFKGDTYEGHTFEKALEDLKKQYQIDKIIVVADRGMLSKNNLQITTEKGYEFIIGERLKSLPKAIQAPLLDLGNYKHEWVYNDPTGEAVIIKYTTINYDGKTIIATYSANRAKKDKQDREDKLSTAKKLLENPALLKKKPARFFLQSNGKEAYSLDENKIEQSKKYDGFLAISTNNATLGITEVLEQYKQLYKIEHSFRTFKSHLETRPMFHWTDARIEGHICLCYIAFALQNYVLQKINKSKQTFSEASLRNTLDKMQVSLIRHKTEHVYLRSAPCPNEAHLQQQMAVKPLPEVVAQNKLSIYFN